MNVSSFRRSAGALLFVTATSVHAQDFATTVVDYSPGGGLGSFDPALALGGPRGGGFFQGSIHAASLGTGGSLTLGFGVTLTDGPGADFTVFENGFYDLGLSGVFAETAFVEVSSNGVDFARFPVVYDGPTGPLPPFGTTAVGTFRGLTGGLAVLANVDTNTLSVVDPTLSGGECFDLADLANDPLVLSGMVDLAAIDYVRLVDLVEGVNVDAFGMTIWDNGGSASSADVDSVSVLNHTGNQGAGRPTLEMYIDAFDRLNIVFEDPDGLDDIVDVNAAASQVPFSFVSVLHAFFVIELTPTRAHLWMKKAVSGTGWLFTFAMSVTDSTGQVSADMAYLQDLTD
jgi:hypothetical protein